MSQTQIAVIVGSLRKDSINRKLAEALIRLSPPHVSYVRVRIDDIPPYNQDDDDDQPEPVKRLRGEVGGSDGVLFVTPEYNRSIPGVLKNVLDHGSRPYGQSIWTGKPAGIAGASVGPMSTALAQQHLRNVLSALDMPLLRQPEAYIFYKDGFFDEKGDVDLTGREFLQSWIKTFTEFVEGQAKA